MHGLAIVIYPPLYSWSPSLQNDHVSQNISGVIYGYPGPQCLTQERKEGGEKRKKEKVEKNHDSLQFIYIAHNLFIK